MTLGNAVRHMQSNGAALNSMLHNLSQNRGGTTVEVPARSSNSPPPSPHHAAGAIAIGESSSSSVAAQLAGETARPRRTKGRSRSPSARKTSRHRARHSCSDAYTSSASATATCSDHSAETSSKEKGTRASWQLKACSQYAARLHDGGIDARP